MANQSKQPPEAAVKKKKSSRLPNSARLAKLVIQRRTLALLLIFGVAAFLALFAKAYDLTIRQHDQLQDSASSQQMRSTVISASRGSILDRNGVTLAVSGSADTVFLDPRAIDNYANELDKKRAQKLVDGLKDGEKLPMSGQEYKDLLAGRLSEILGIEAQTVYDNMAKTNWQYAVLVRRVEKEVSDQIRAFIVDNETGASLQGVHLETDSKRYYPRSSLASHVIGFLDGDNHGAYGLEALYNEELEGTTGLTVTAKEAGGSEIMFQYEQYYDAEDGHTIQTTIDSTLQYYLERGLEDMTAEFGAKNGACGIMLDPKTGAILAIASTPNYDLNSPRTIYTERLQSQLAEADEENPPEDGSEHSDAYWELMGQLQNRQWRNKAVNDTYEPGSTFKILTLAMALEEGVANRNSTYYCGGSVHITGVEEPIHCSNRNGHGSQTLKEAVGHSCNPAFIKMGLDIRSATFYDYLDQFGLFEPTGVDLQGEGTSIVHKRETFVSADVYVATYSFGQTINVTPIQLIAAQAACINGGYLYQPYVVEKELDSEGNVVKQHDSTPIRQVVSEETSAMVRECLEYVVSDGGGKNGQVTGYRIGGKTGTADKTGTKTADNPRGDVVVSFLCFAPADDPQVIMLLTMDTPARQEITGVYVSGGNYVAPTASKIMADVLPYLGIAPQYDEDNQTAAEGTVPYVMDMSKDEAAAKLADYGFASYRTVGDGDTVTDQTPAGGAIVPTGAEIILYMGAEKSGEMCTVPNVEGMTADEANRTLVNAGLIMKATGASGRGAKAISQSLESGSEVTAGTVVTVQMGTMSNVAD
ncbi:MAG: PASTA domain-containing protein [Oscillospiraceae bacterium]|nr:PASTA domain-containing protein [Oscillospiraceae bacterium]